MKIRAASAVMATAAALVMGTPGIAAAGTPDQLNQTTSLETLTQLPPDPYSGPAPYQHQTAVEPTVFTAGKTLIATYQVGRRSSGLGAENLMFARSTDQGRTWSGGPLPGITRAAGGPWAAVSDPSVAHDAKHKTWMIGGMEAVETGFAQGVSLSRSTDDGRTWQSPRYADFAGQHHYDKTWVTCDDHRRSPHYGTCYLTWEDPITLSIFMQRSTDGGSTWSAPVEPQGGAHGFGGVPVVQRDGTVIVPYQENILPPQFISVFSSPDGGDHWGPSTRIAQIQQHFPSRLRTEALPSVGLSDDGRLYLTWQDSRFSNGANDVVLSTSRDGTEWSAVTRIPFAPMNSGEEFDNPAIAVDHHTRGAHTHLSIIAYELNAVNCNPCTLSVVSMTSRDAGGTWDRRVLAKGIDTRWLATTADGPFVGDYEGAVFSRGRAVSVFPVASAPTGTTLHEAVVASADRSLG